MEMSFIVFKMLALIAFISYSECVEVTTGLGNIRGVTLKSRLGIDFHAFRGIRYAEAPIGPLRFKNPKPVKPWKPNIFDATDDGPMCPQPTQNLTDLSEDCLRLNVYTKDIKGKKPVVVYLHPGGFYFFSGQSKNHAGPQHLMDRDIVLVTLNYRLGTLGFLATGTAEAPGNAGFKDQVLALRWIREHISNFGGDPESVTLFGYSAGSFSISLHMMSPMAKGLFHRGIAMSASAFGQCGFHNDGLYLARRQARLLSCPTESNEELVKCLQEKPMMDFVNSQGAMFEVGWHPVLNWRPVIESDFGQERYLTEHPYTTMLSGNIHKVPLITGITEFEFISAAYITLKNDTQRKLFNDNFEKYAPIAFLYERESPKSKRITQRLRSAYLGNKTLEMQSSLEPLGRLCSDSLVGFEYHRFLDLISRYVPVYTYLFTYKGRYSFFTLPNNETYGAVHHDELLYLLHIPLVTPLFKSSDPENEVIERLTRMWTEFAKKGDPNNSQDEYLKNVNWSLYTKGNKDYLEIGQSLVPKTGGIYEERFKLWDELFPIEDYMSFV